MQPLLERKTSFLGLLSLIILFLPISFIHEAGHIIVCVLDGFTYTLTFTAIDAGISCHGTPNNLLFYWTFGGMLATIISLSPFLAWNWIKRNKGIMIALLTLATGHAANAFIETFWHIWYLENMKYATIVVVIPTVMAFFIYLFLFARIKR